MTRRTTKRRARLPAGAWRRFFTALAALIAVLVGVPALLIVCSRVGLDASHPFPALGSIDEIRAFFERDLTPTEIAPVAMRVLLIVGWALWLGMALSVLASIFEARGSALRSWVPQFTMFAGLGRWIAAGLTAVSALAPNFVSAASLASPRPFTISSVTPDRAVAVESPVAPGFGRVQRGESIETFAERLLGDPNRWPELWDLNKDHEVGPDGEVWTAPWKLAAGWDLRLPRDAVPVEPIAAVSVRSSLRAVDAAPTVSAWARTREPHRGRRVRGRRRRFRTGAIAERFLPAGSSAHDVWDFTEALMGFNAPRLGYAHPAMLHPGDVVDIVTPATTAPEAEEPSESTPSHVVVAGDSYWEIAEETLGDEATAHEVLQLTSTLIDLNSSRLGYGDGRLIHPGDVVYLVDPDTPTSTQVDPTSASATDLLSDVDVIAIDELPPAPVAPASTDPPPTTSTTTTSTSAASECTRSAHRG